MIRASQIPDQVVEALHTSLADDAGALVPKSDCVTAIAAAINAWPGVTTTSWFEGSTRKAVLNIPLPLPQESTNAEG